ncbi:Rieske [2Fe-2S] domain-containing protein [Pseudomonas sp. NFIX10]|uniref:Rieske 2Fe-2S domain-containing protein n=1 Tax=unclassified Pseudomonas TaxID=196821 RepID=UPI0008E5859E|nr:MULTISPECIES: Rieske 2Fe-2S domain-containing protein [unclassified Pseudomonas]SFB46352.1 Rieske [2Fe-2S] domain-containing protein [Pseudomonas sp. NFIX10]SFF18877.1 Rieske [2Fe-2S] domain-containing protein [Pseudomonas sp. NFACC06-1]
MSFLRNVWCTAAWGVEVKAGALFQRTLLNEPVVFFRDAQGTAQAIADHCPHRFAPQADAALIPDFSCMDDDNWYVGKRHVLDRLIAAEYSVGAQ